MHPTKARAAASRGYRLACGAHPGHDRVVPLDITTDHTAIAALLDPMLRADPVRTTVLGTLRHDLRATAWCASTPGGAVAVRCADVFPVVVAGAWDADRLVELVPLLGELPNLAGLSGPVDLVRVLAAALGRPAHHVLRSRLYRLDDLGQPAVAGCGRRAGADDRALVAAWYAAFMTETGTPPVEVDRLVDGALDAGCFLWFDPAGTPVSMAVHRPVVAGSSRIGPVYTPPAARGHGYGSAATAAATRSVLDLGGIPVLFTDITNPTSNSIYQELGYYPVGDFEFVSFR